MTTVAQLLSLVDTLIICEDGNLPLDTSSESELHTQHLQKSELQIIPTDSSKDALEIKHVSHHEVSQKYTDEFDNFQKAPLVMQ